MARPKPHVGLVLAAALLATGCHDTEIVASLTAAIGVVAAALSAIRGLAGHGEKSRSLARRFRSALVLFAAGLLVGGGVSFFLFVEDGFQLADIVPRATKRIGHLFSGDGHDHDHAGGDHGTPAEGAGGRNWLIAQVSCPKCDVAVDLCSQFKYGALCLRVYRLGDEVQWEGGEAAGERTDDRVWVRAWAEACPVCGATYLDYAIRVDGNRIAAQEPVADVAVWRNRNWVTGAALK